MPPSPRSSPNFVTRPRTTAFPTPEEAFRRRAAAVVERHMRDEEFGVARLAAELGMGRASLYRSMKTLTGQSPFKFIRTLRLRRAAQLLDSGECNVSRALDLVGISNLSHFGKIFRAEYGMSPSAYCHRPRQETARVARGR